MAHALGAANALAGSLGLPLQIEDAFPLHPRDNSTAGNNTVNMFIDSESGQFRYAASVVTACADKTMYALQCTAGPEVEGYEICGSTAPVIIITSGSSLYEGSVATSTKTMGIEVALTAQETCVLAGTTAATCTATAEISASGTSTSSAAITTITGSHYHRFDVTITAGAEKTQNPAAKCAKNAASSLNIPKVVLLALFGALVASTHTML